MSQRIISSYLLPFARFLRVSELLYIKRSDIIFESCYVSIFIPKSKTDIYRDRNTVVISRMGNNLCPVKKIRKIFIVSEYFAKFR
jgi:integrase